MPTRDSRAEIRWQGDLTSGSGVLNSETGTIRDQTMTWSARLGEQQGPTPEELIAAAHASCFSMAFSNMLDSAGHTPTELHTEAVVRFEKGKEPPISQITLHVSGDVPGIDQKQFAEIAAAAKDGCPVSQALTGTQIQVEAKLRQPVGT